MIVSGHSAEGLGLRRPLDGPVAPSTRRVCAQQFSQKHGKRVFKTDRPSRVSLRVNMCVRECPCTVTLVLGNRDKSLH